jgi:hypothetical protein
MHRRSITLERRWVTPAEEENIVDPSAATDRSGDQMPSVADYWPDSAELPLRTPRHAAEPGPADDGIIWIKPRKTGRVRLGAVLGLALLLVIGGVLTVLLKQAHTEPAPSAAAPATSPEPTAASPVPTGTVPLAPAPTTKPVPPPAKKIVAPRPPVTATFEMAATAGSVIVRSQNLGAERYRVTLAKSAARAKVTDTASTHRLTLVKDQKTPAPPITITLNSGLRWNLKLTAGNTETAVDLTQSRLASLELAGGAHVFTLTLPPATGTLPVRVTHGMNQLKIRTNGDPVRATLRAGAGKVILDGVTHTGAKPGKVLTSDGWSGAADRIDLDSVEGVGTLTIDTD